MPLIDMSGMHFGRLTVLRRDGKTSYGKPLWLCQCECGNTTHVTRKHLIGGGTISCGCYRREHSREQHTTHGLSKTSNRHNRLYRIWTGIKDRCCNPNSKYWNKYGGRGITVCKEWADDYMVFHAWAINNGYLDNLTLDRIDNDGNYEPDNCRWATYETQENNRSDNVLFNVGGEMLTLSQLAKKDGTTRAITERNHKEEKYGKRGSKDRA